MFLIACIIIFWDVLGLNPVQKGVKCQNFRKTHQEKKFSGYMDARRTENYSIKRRQYVYTTLMLLYASFWC
jgi:hypothetical protein